METGENIILNKAQLKAIGGSDIFDCINEAIQFAAKHDIKCTLIHNSIEVEVSTQELKETIYNMWNKLLKEACKK